MDCVYVAYLMIEKNYTTFYHFISATVTLDDMVEEMENVIKAIEDNDFGRLYGPINYPWNYETWRPTNSKHGPDYDNDLLTLNATYDRKDGGADYETYHIQLLSHKKGMNNTSRDFYKSDYRKDCESAKYIRQKLSKRLNINFE